MTKNAKSPQQLATPEDVAWTEKIAEERESPERSDKPLTATDLAKVAEMAEQLEHNKQRRTHRESLISFVLYACGGMILSFVLITWILYTCNATSLPENSWFFLPLALMGILPTAVILSALKGLYTPNEQPECVTAKDLTIASQLISIFKAFK